MNRLPALMQQRDRARTQHKRDEQPKREHKRPLETLQEYQQSLDAHQWSNFTNTYVDFITQFKEENRLLARGIQLGPAGFHAFREAREAMIMSIVDTAVQQAQQSTAEYYKKEIAELRARYVKPIDTFREDLDKHDWTYEYIEENQKWSKWAENEDQLIRRAILGGEEFIQAFKERYNRAFRDGRTCNWDMLVRRHKANNPGMYDPAVA